MTLWKIWFVSVNLIISIIIFIATKKRNEKYWIWTIFTFLVTAFAVPLYLKKRTGRSIFVPFVFALYVLIIFAGMPHIIFAGMVKASPFLKVDYAGKMHVLPQRYKGPNQPWEGRRVVAIGTSITAGSDATFLNGFVDRAGLWLHEDLINEGQGSSGIVWDGKRNRSLSATRSELIAAGFDPNSSYEERLIGKKADLVIFDHGYNDREMALGSIDSKDKSTFYGAYNIVIAALRADRPSCKFIFVTPPSLYTPDNTYNEKTVAIRLAILTLAERYKAPVLDFGETFDLDRKTSATSFSADGIHPNDDIHQQMARKLYQFMLDLGTR